MKVTNQFLLLWWADHRRDAGFYDHLEEMVEMDTEQSIFAAGLPASGKKLASEEILTAEEILKRLGECYKTEFLADGPNKKSIRREIEQEKTKIKMLGEIVWA